MEKRAVCGTMIKQLNDELEKQANNALRSHGLTVGQLRMLVELAAAPDKKLTLKELERLLHVAQSTAAGIAARLEQKGFVESLGDPGDRRIKLVRITPEGETCCLLANQDMLGAEERLLAPLTELERIGFFNLLRKATQALE